MLVVDWIFVGVLLVSVALGLWRGLVYEVLSVANWLLAFMLAQWWGVALGQRLPLGEQLDTLRHLAGFVVVFLGAVFAGGLLIWGISKLVGRVGLRPVDRMLGGAFGMLRWLIVLMAVAWLVQMTPIQKQAWWHESLTADFSLWTLNKLKPVLPPSVSKYFP